MAKREPGDERRRDRGSDHGAGGIDADGQAAFFRFEAFGDDPGRGRIVSGFAQAQQEAGRAQLRDVVGQPREHVGDGPPCHEQGQADAGPKNVGQSAGDDIGNRV